MTRLIGKEPCITFVTLGELIQWAEQTPAVGPAQTATPWVTGSTA
jgi:hypothetical protein